MRTILSLRLPYPSTEDRNLWGKRAIGLFIENWQRPLYKLYKGIDTLKVNSRATHYTEGGESLGDPSNLLRKSLRHVRCLETTLQPLSILQDFDLQQVQRLHNLCQVFKKSSFGL